MQVLALNCDGRRRDRTIGTAIQRSKDADAIGAFEQVLAVELSGIDDVADGGALGIDVSLDLGAVISVQVFLSGNDQFLHILQEARDLLGSSTGDTHGRRPLIQGVGDLVEAFHIRRHHGRDSPDGGVVFCSGHLFTGRNLGLDRLEIAVDSAQSLQRNHRTIIGQNTGHLNVPHVRQASDLVAA